MENDSINYQLLRPKCRCAPGFLFVGVGVVILLGGGCGPSGASGGDPDRNAYFQKARKSEEQRDYQTAAGLYQRALETDPQLARAHLELGLLNDEKLGDPIAAIYHYRQYLALDPQTDKRQLVEDFIERAKLSLASKLPQSAVADPAELTRLQNQTVALMQENAALRARIAEMERGAAVAAATPAAAATPVVAAASASGTVSTASAPSETYRTRTHLVQKGDTLQSLALKYYGTRSAWDKIYEVNRNVLASKDQLRIGQQLLIP